MPVLCLFTQSLQAFEQPEPEHADAIDCGSFLDLLFNLAQPLHRVVRRRTETGRRLHCRGQRPLQLRCQDRIVLKRFLNGFFHGLRNAVSGEPARVEPQQVTDGYIGIRAPNG
jgi:hypothetical protein